MKKNERKKKKKTPTYTKASNKYARKNIISYGYKPPCMREKIIIITHTKFHN